MSCTAEGITSTKAIRLNGLQNNEAPSAGNSHSQSEIKIRSLVEKFRSEFLETHSHLKERLLLLPKNEFGVEKFVCSFLRPTLLPFAETYDLKLCSEFVSRHVLYEALQESTTVTVSSPAKTLAWAVGDCFDLSFLFASLLIGAGYDAYVFCGKAPEWIRTKDMGHVICSLEQKGDGGSLEVIIKGEMYTEMSHYSTSIVVSWKVNKGEYIFHPR